MMLLNLISPQMHETLRQRVILSAARSLVIVVVCVEIIFASVLFAGDLQLKAKTKSLSQEADQSSLLLRAKGQATVADTTKVLNSQIKILQDLQKRYVRWVPIFKTFSDLTPEGITLTSIQFSQSTGKVKFSGVASTREAYTNYETVLQKSALLQDVVFPLQTIKTALVFNIETPFTVPH
jgi:Tfp pilus assembly protein PilN